VKEYRLRVIILVKSHSLSDRDNNIEQLINIEDFEKPQKDDFLFFNKNDVL